MALRDVPDHVMVVFQEAGLERVLVFEQTPIRRPSRSVWDRNRFVTGPLLDEPSATQ